MPELSDRVTIEALDRIEDMEAVVQLQCSIWGYGQPGADFPLPARVLLAIARSGGLVALASIENEPAALSVAWIGRDRQEQSLFLHSQMLGVADGCRHRGLGLKMKLHQRRFALDSGLDRMCWTFDPLQSANARLNLHKLGATVRRYHRDYFGRMRSVFNEGISSDRVWAEWELDSDRTRSRLAGETPVNAADAHPINQFVPSRWPVPGELTLDSDAHRLRLAIPDDFDQLRSSQPAVAQRWREHVREALTECFDRGYCAVDLQVDKTQGSRRVSYLLERD